MPVCSAIASPSVRRAHGGLKRSCADLRGDEVHELLGVARDVLVVGVGLVPLEHRELGVVLEGQPLVAEVLADLVDALEAADDQPLEVQLDGDAKVEVAVERVEVRRERQRRAAAVDRLQHRRLDLDEAALVEPGADRGDDLGPRHEDLARVLVRDQVELAVAEAGLDVGQPVVLLGRRAQRLGQQLVALELQRELAAAGAEDRAVGADQVAEVEREQALAAAPRPARRGARAAASGRCGRRGRGTPPCPGRGGRRGGRRCGRGPRSPRRRAARRTAP